MERRFSDVPFGTFEMKTCPKMGPKIDRNGGQKIDEKRLRKKDPTWTLASCRDFAAALVAALRGGPSSHWKELRANSFPVPVLRQVAGYVTSSNRAMHGPGAVAWGRGPIYPLRGCGPRPRHGTMAHTM